MKYTDDSNLREFFENEQVVEYKGMRLAVSYVNHDEIYLTGNLDDRGKPFKRGSKKLEKVIILEPLLNSLIEQSNLDEITHTIDEKSPIMDLDVESLIEKVKPKRKFFDSYAKKQWEDIESKIRVKDYSDGLVDDWIKRRLYKNFTSNELAKIIYTSAYTQADRGKFLEEHNPTLWMIHKIKSSYWRTSYTSDNWNQIVDSYNSIKNFDLNKKDFSIKLDTTSYFNEKGYSRFSRTFLDGVFSFVVHYKNKPVMDVSFSVSNDKKGNNLIQLSQFQCINNKGNRWIYKFGHDYVEQITKMFIEQFPNHKIQLRKADNLETEIRTSYTRLLEREEKYYNDRVRCADDESSIEYALKCMTEAQNMLSLFELNGVSSIHKTLGFKFKSLKRTRCSEKYNNLIEV